MKNIMDEMNLPYTFDKWDADLVLPHWIGEISEIQNDSFNLTREQQDSLCLKLNEFK